MTAEEKLKIETDALLEKLGQYEYISKTYCTQTEAALSPFDIGKLEYCIQSFRHWFEDDKCSDFERNSDYLKVLELLDQIQETKDTLAKRKREVVPLMQFWTAINAWLENEALDPALLYNEKYRESYCEYSQWRVHGSVDLDSLYKLVYGKRFEVISEDNISFEKLKEFTEAYYSEIVEVNKGRYNFTVKNNQLFNRFHLPFYFKNGKLLNKSYKTTFSIEPTGNYEQFERKIEYAAEMVMHGEFIDKHSALKYIADAFCYFESLYKKDSAKKLGLLVNVDTNTRTYSIVKNEVELIGKIINNEFDIRHNELNSAIVNGKSVKREILNDPIFVEYLYNRINALLMLLRIKRNQKQKSENLTERSSLSPVFDDNLPF